LTDAGTKHNRDGLCHSSPDTNPPSGIQSDANAAQQHSSTLATWTITAGPSNYHPTSSLTATPYIQDPPALPTRATGRTLS
ncbi:hypothetical protein PUR53_11360, partial [Streptomyces sp. SP18BB07]|nr:hypothetical protein [Streptomyces sp. SP18BB07]